MFKIILMASTLLTSVSTLAQTMAGTVNQALNLTCVVNETPLFIELNSAHDKAKLHLNNYVDEQGRGHSRKLIATFSLKDKKVTHPYGSNILTFNNPRPSDSDARGMLLTIPRYMNNFGGMANQPASIVTLTENLNGFCYVQFLPVPPSL